jgi:hypothetical protein
MKRTLIAAVAVFGLVLGACSSDDDTSSDSTAAPTTAAPPTTEAAVGDLTADQAAAAQSAIDQAAAGGITLDEACVNDIAAQLSPEDAALAASDPDAELSVAGEALGTELLRCAPDEALVDLFISGLTDSGEPVDEACARERLQGVDIVGLVIAIQASGSPPLDVVESLAPCFAGGTTVP